jgi:DNA-binding sugar fermentation-stimulating protein
MILFIIQRDDITHFEVSNGDPVYKEALKKAKKSGVDVRAISIKWVQQKNTDSNTYNITPICGNNVKVEL